MAIQILLCFESLFTDGARKVENVAVSCLMTFHVSLLNESLATVTTFVRLLPGVKKHVSIEAEHFREIFIANLTMMNSVFGRNYRHWQLAYLVTGYWNRLTNEDVSNLSNSLQVNYLLHLVLHFLYFTRRVSRLDYERAVHQLDALVDLRFFP